MTFPSLYGIFSLSNEVLKPKACQGLGVFKSKGSLLKISRSHLKKTTWAPLGVNQHFSHLSVHQAPRTMRPTCGTPTAAWNCPFSLFKALWVEKTQQKRGPLWRSWELQNQNDGGHQTNFKHKIQKQKTQDKRKKTTTPFLEGTSKSVWMTGVAASSHEASESERLQAKFYLLTSGEQSWLIIATQLDRPKAIVIICSLLSKKVFSAPPQFLSNFVFLLQPHFSFWTFARIIWYSWVTFLGSNIKVTSWSGQLTHWKKQETQHLFLSVPDSPEDSSHEDHKISVSRSGRCRSNATARTIASWTFESTTMAVAKLKKTPSRTPDGRLHVSFKYTRYRGWFLMLLPSWLYGHSCYVIQLTGPTVWPLLMGLENQLIFLLNVLGCLWLTQAFIRKLWMGLRFTIPYHTTKWIWATWNTLKIPCSYGTLYCKGHSSNWFFVWMSVLPVRTAIFSIQVAAEPKFPLIPLIPFMAWYWALAAWNRGAKFFCALGQTNLIKFLNPIISSLEAKFKYP